MLDLSHGIKEKHKFVILFYWILELWALCVHNNIIPSISPQPVLLVFVRNKKIKKNLRPWHHWPFNEIDHWTERYWGDIEGFSDSLHHTHTHTTSSWAISHTQSSLKLGETPLSSLWPISTWTSPAETKQPPGKWIHNHFQLFNKVPLILFLHLLTWFDMLWHAWCLYEWKISFK